MSIENSIEALVSAIVELTVAVKAANVAPAAPAKPKKDEPNGNPTSKALAAMEPAPKAEAANTPPTAPANDVPAPKAEASAAPSPEQAFAELRDVFLGVFKTDAGKAQGVLAKFNVPKLSGLKPEQYADALAQLKAA